MHEWPLVIFTLLMQASVGCLMVTMLCHQRTFASLRQEQVLSLLRLPLLAAFVFGALGLLASVFHLGNPLHMFYTLLHVASSWMSREVLVTGIYMGLLFISLGILLLRKRLPVGLLALTLLVGLIDIYVMSAIYAHTLFTLWSGAFTYSAFYGSTLLLGGILGCALLIPGLKAQGCDVEARRVLRIALAICVFGLLLLLISAFSLLTQVGVPVSLGITEKVLPASLLSLTLTRVALLTLGFLFAGRLLCSKRGNGMTLLLSLAALCVIAGEVVGRYQFFTLGG